MKDIELSRRIASALIKTGKTNDELAQILGVNKNTISAYKHEKGDLKGIVLEGLAKIGFNPVWLLTGEGEMLCKSICGSLKQDFNHNIVTDSLGEGVRMLTKIHDKNQNLFEIVMKYLRHAVGMIDIGEGGKISGDD